MNLDKTENPAHRQWEIQVWANYHYGNMSPEDALLAAGPEPDKYIDRDNPEDEVKS